MSLESQVRALEREGKSLGEILTDLRQSRGSEAERLALRRASVAQTFDEKAFAAVIAKDLPLTLRALLAQGDVDVVHPADDGRRRARGMRYCVKPPAREEALLAWKRQAPEELQAFATVLRRYFTRRGDATNALACALHANPGEARTEFMRLYREADEVFDYPRLDDVLQILRDRVKVLEGSLIEALNDREQYYDSRTLHADDWMRSALFLERPAVLKDLQRFLRSKEQWVLHLHATGGMGKTAFLRWFISRYVIVERTRRSQRIPTARLDFDVVDPGAVRQWPWLVLAPIVRQLDAQLPNGPLGQLKGRFQPIHDALFRTRREDPGGKAKLFATVQSVAPTLAPRAYDDFALALGPSRVLIVFDTVEEMMLHQPEPFAHILGGLQKVRGSGADTRAVQVVLSGRYPLTEVDEFKPIAAILKGALRSVLVPPFTAAESRRYLGRVRRITSPALVRRIVAAAQGNPFKLALLADLAEGRGGLKAQDLRHPEIAYLLRRVIERVPEDEWVLRWTLRYAVIPRQLDREFFEHALKPHLEREIAAKAAERLDSTTGGLPAGFRNPWKFVEGGKVDTGALWTAMRKYAGPRSWVRFEGDTPILQPEVIAPMQALLRREKIYSALHVSAAEYFRALAAAYPDDWARWTAEEAYHRILGQGAEGVDYWLTCFERPDARRLRARHLLAEAVVNTSLLDDRGEPRLDPVTGLPLVGDAAIGRARFELVSVAVQRADHGPAAEASTQIAEAERQLRLLKRVERRAAAAGVEPGERAFVAASLAARRRRRAHVIAACRKALALYPQTPYAAPLLALMADQMHETPVEASALYAQAEEIGRKPGMIGTVDLYKRRSRLWFDAGNFEEARKVNHRRYLEALAMHEPPRGVEAIAGLIEAARLSMSTVEINQLLERLRGPVKRPGLDGIPLVERGRAIVALQQGVPIDPAPEDTGNHDAVVQRALWRAEDLCNRFRTEEAFQLIESATDTARRSMREDLVERLTLAKASVALDVLGDHPRARSILSERAVSAENQLTRELLELRLAGRTRRQSVHDIWSGIRRSLFPRLSRWSKAHALSHWLSSGAPSLPDWREFGVLCREMQPAGARHFLIQPFYRASVLMPKDREVLALFPEPAADDADFISKALPLAMLLWISGEQARAESLLAQAMVRVAQHDNLVVVERLVYAARRVRPPLPDDFTRAALEAINHHRAAEPYLAAVVALQLADWQSQRRQPDAFNTLLFAFSIRQNVFRFEGRYATLEGALSRKLDVSRRVREDAALPREPALDVQIAAAARQQLSWVIRGPHGEYRQPALKLGRFGFNPRNPLQELGAAVQRWTGGKLSSGIAGVPEQGPTDYILRCESDVAALPLEGLLTLPKPRFVYRSPGQSPLSWKSPMVTGWFHDLLYKLHRRPVTKHWSSRDQRVLDDILRERGIPHPASSAEGKRSLRTVAQHDSSVFVVKGGERVERRRGYGAAGIDFEEVAWTVRRQVADAPTLPAFNQMLQVANPDLLWLVGYLEPSGSEILLRIGDQVHEGQLTLTPHLLFRAISGTSSASRVMIFLDVPDDPLRGTQLVLRNRFAHALYEAGAARAVLAAGLAERYVLRQYLQTIVDALHKRDCEGRLLQALAPLCLLPPVLYSPDATFPIV